MFNQTVWSSNSSQPPNQHQDAPLSPRKVYNQTVWSSPPGSHSQQQPSGPPSGSLVYNQTIWVPKKTSSPPPGPQYNPGPQYSNPPPTPPGQNQSQGQQMYNPPSLSNPGGGSVCVCADCAQTSRGRMESSDGDPSMYGNSGGSGGGPPYGNSGGVCVCVYCAQTSRRGGSSGSPSPYGQTVWGSTATPEPCFALPEPGPLSGYSGGPSPYGQTVWSSTPRPSTPSGYSDSPSGYSSCSSYAPGCREKAEERNLEQQRTSPWQSPSPTPPPQQRQHVHHQPADVPSQHKLPEPSAVRPILDAESAQPEGDNTSSADRLQGLMIKRPLMNLSNQVHLPTISHAAHEGFSTIHEGSWGQKQVPRVFLYIVVLITLPGGCYSDKSACDKQRGETVGTHRGEIS